MEKYLLQTQRIQYPTKNIEKNEIRKEGSQKRVRDKVGQSMKPNFHDKQNIFCGTLKQLTKKKEQSTRNIKYCDGNAIAEKDIK